MIEICEKYYKNKLGYSERDKKIWSYIENKSEDIYDEIICDDNDYYTFCQLSELRKGILSWYPFKNAAKVLEVGAGFGAITGFLCEKCEEVIVTERSYFRCNAIAKRHSQYDNLQIYAGDILDMDFEAKFDYIILIGILERIGGGSKEITRYSKYLDSLQRFLKPDGIILFAVENRLGLKYFCGDVEPHTKRPFDGLSNYKRGTSGRSFSHKEVEDIIKNTVFKQYRFYYPLPDYKLPQLIYTDEYLPQNNLKERLIPYYPFNKTLLTNEVELYGDIIENGVFPFFANSFLVECSKEKVSEKVLYAAISTDRGKERSFATTIYKDCRGRLKVNKKSLYKEGRENQKKLYNNILDLEKHGIPVVQHTWFGENGLEMPCIDYMTLSNYIKKIISKDINEFLNIIKKLYEYILASSNVVNPSKNEMPILSDVDDNVDIGPILEKAYIELIPLNCFYDSKTREFLFFDQEFMRTNYPAKYILFRAINYIYCFTPNANEFYSIEKLKEEYGLRDLWESFVVEEKRFLDEVRNHNKYKAFYKWADMSQEAIDNNVDKLLNKKIDKEVYHVSEKMKKIWQVELDILDNIDTICKKYDLKYFMVHGSLLGAVRHKGFIPWDDDLDIAMPREDYDRFLDIAKNELKKPLSLHNFYTEKDIFFGGYTRIRNELTTAIETRELNHEGNQGIWVDIIPFDICTMDEKKYMSKEKKIRHYQRLFYAKIYGNEYSCFMDMNKITWWFYRFISKFIDHDNLAKKLDASMRMYTNECSEDIAAFTGYHKHRRLSLKDFEKTTYLTFEGRQVPVPEGYENYLFVVLGKDYLKYPPIEERKPKHKGIYDAEHPYTLYKQMFCETFNDIEGKNLILFGSGMMFEDYMTKYGDKYRPTFLVDNDQNKWGRQRMGISIKQPEAILDIPIKKRKIIICSYYYREIAEQLEQMGIHDYKVYIQNIEWVLRTEEQK